MATQSSGEWFEIEYFDATVPVFRKLSRLPTRWERIQEFGFILAVKHAGDALFRLCRQAMEPGNTVSRNGSFDRIDVGLRLPSMWSISSSLRIWDPFASGFMVSFSPMRKENSKLLSCLDSHSNPAEPPNRHHGLRTVKTARESFTASGGYQAEPGLRQKAPGPEGQNPV